MRNALSNFFTPALALAAALAGTPASAAPAVVCRGAGGEVSSAVPYAFAEANARRKLQFADSDEPLAAQLDAALARLVEEGALPPEQTFARTAELRESRGLLEAAPALLPAGARLGTPELGEAPITLPAGCAVETVAEFDPAKGFRMLSDVFAQLNETQKAALWAQEIVELTARRMQATRAMIPPRTWESMSDARKRYLLDTSAAVLRELPSRVRRTVSLLFARGEIAGSLEEIRRERQVHENAGVLLTWSFRRVVVVPRGAAVSLRALLQDPSLDERALRCSSRGDMAGEAAASVWLPSAPESTAAVRAYRLPESAHCRFLAIEGEREVKGTLSFGEARVPFSSYDPLVLYF